MNSGIKRLLSMLMALIMVFSMITPVSVSAASNAASNAAKEIEVGETIKLNVPGTYARITWKSSDNGIAKVSGNGTVTGVAPGTATITATYRTHFGFWGRNKTTTFTVVVTEPETQDVTVEEGKTLQLSVNAKGGKVAWSSSNSNVATVNKNGQLRGIAPGTATVTAKISRSHGFFGKKTETVYFKVTVTEAPQEEAPEAPETLTVKEGETLQLTVDAKGGKVTWKSSNKRIATVNGRGLVKGIRQGNVTITATVTKTANHRFPWQRPGRPTTEVIKFEVTVLPEAPAINYFTVTFNSNGGSEVAAQTIEEGMTVIEPEEPTLDGHTFMGWYADEALTQEYDFAAVVTGDVTLYAKWDENEPAKPTMPENPSEADEYYFNNSEVIDVIIAEESEVVPCEAEVVNLLGSRGFTESEIIYDFTIDGTYIGSTNVQHASQTKRPAYFTYYRTENGDIWIVYVINDAVTAYPLSYNAECDLPVDLMISESETITSYVDETNQYYVTIPYESAMIVRIVERIDAETLEQLTFDAIDAMG